MARIVAGSNRPRESSTSPRSSMNALIPETAACTTHRPFSTARRRLICRCCAEAAVRS